MKGPHKFWISVNFGDFQFLDYSHIFFSERVASCFIPEFITAHIPATTPISPSNTRLIHQFRYRSLMIIIPRLVNAIFPAIDRQPNKFTFGAALLFGWKGDV
ncbi:hypothetical protein Hanom_Chr07g00678391 [Helianthus anomalus]